jgi:hypothetical protein
MNHYPTERRHTTGATLDGSHAALVRLTHAYIIVFDRLWPVSSGSPGPAGRRGTVRQQQANRHGQGQPDNQSPNLAGQDVR